LALIGRELWVLGLRHHGAKYVQATDVLVLRRDAAKRFIQALGIPTRELRDAAHAKNFKIT
jgi:hypothetical protein